MGMLLGAARMRVDDALKVEQQEEEAGEANQADSSASSYREMGLPHGRSQPLSHHLDHHQYGFQRYSHRLKKYPHTQRVHSHPPGRRVAVWSHRLHKSTLPIIKFENPATHRSVVLRDILAPDSVLFVDRDGNTLQNLFLLAIDKPTYSHVVGLFSNTRGGDDPRYPDVIVIAFVIMLVGLSAIVHEYVEKPTTKWVQNLVG